jgi:hypothetical protein
MPKPEQNLIPETSLYRLTAQEPDTVLRERAVRLYRVVRRNIHLFSGLLQDSVDSLPRANQEPGNNATTPEYKIGTKQTVYVDFFVPLDSDHLKGTANWLLEADLTRLQINTYAEELPSDSAEWPNDADSETAIEISPAPEYGVEGGSLPSVTYAAAYEDGPRLDARNTETVIGILTLVADQRQAELA